MAAMTQNLGDRNSTVQNHSAISGAERRTAPRYSLDEGVRVHPVSGATALRGRIRDLSMGGCRLEIDTRLLTGAMLRVELQFQIRGISFRLAGVTAGKRTKDSVGIRFVDLNERRREDIAQVLTEISAAEQAAKLDPQQKLQEQPGSVSTPRSELRAVAVDVKISAESRPEKATPHHHGAAPVTAPSALHLDERGVHIDVPVAPQILDSTAAPASRDRRAHQRLKVDTRARLYLVNTGISMQGSIQDLSMAGCRIVTQERFNVGIYIRAEAEFYLHGLPFRLAGVSQAIINPNTIGLRFVDMSERKREQLSALIAEIREALDEK